MASSLLSANPNDTYLSISAFLNEYSHPATRASTEGIDMDSNSMEFDVTFAKTPKDKEITKNILTKKTTIFFTKKHAPLYCLLLKTKKIKYNKNHIAIFSIIIFLRTSCAQYVSVTILYQVLRVMREVVKN